MSVEVSYRYEWYAEYMAYMMHALYISDLEMHSPYEAYALREAMRTLAPLIVSWQGRRYC